MNTISLRSAVAAAAGLFALMACAGMPSSTAPVQFSGNMLVNKAGMTLYTFDKDPANKSACTGQCAINWPPLLATAQDKASGFDFKIIARDDGTLQWAYDGKPLYLWSKDARPGDMTGNGINKVWRIATKAEEMSSAGGGY